MIRTDDYYSNVMGMGLYIYADAVYITLACKTSSKSNDKRFHEFSDKTLIIALTGEMRFFIFFSD